jgi:hypothetical protein
VASLTSIGQLLRLAAAAGVPRTVISNARREIAVMAEALIVKPDARKVRTVQRGRRIDQLVRQGIEPAVIRKRIDGGISKQAYYRALNEYRDSRYPSMPESSTEETAT